MQTEREGEKVCVRGRDLLLALQLANFRRVDNSSKSNVDTSNFFNLFAFLFTINFFMAIFVCLLNFDNLSQVPLLFYCLPLESY